MIHAFRHISALLLWYSPALALIMASWRVLMYYQLCSYQFKGFLSTIQRQPKHIWLPGCVLGLSAMLVTFSTKVLPLSGHGMIVLRFVASLIILITGYLIGRFEYKAREGKSAFHLTGRAKRFLLVYFLLLIVVEMILRRILPLMGVNIFVVFLLPFWVLLAAVISWPIERLIYELYFRDAQKILNKRKDLIIVGVTGSYGKTSVKFILQTLLSQKYPTLCTRRSGNTPMGIARCVRNDLFPSHKVFIAEMGARHKGDIRELCRLVKPGIGVLTSVGPQHLETFGSIENIKQTKYDLIRSLPKDGFAVFGEDHAICHELYDQTTINKAISGDAGDDCWAEDILTDAQGTHFVLCTKDGTRLPCTTHMEGAHAIKNILLGAVVAKYLGLSDKQLQHGIELLAPVENRFKTETDKQGIHRINNGFNSNPVSSAETLAELGNSKYAGRKIIITPGFVELGREEERYNHELGLNIARVADYALLVGPKHTLPIRAGLIEGGFCEDHIHSFSTLKQANEFYDQIKQEGDYVLYENDLPDHYSET